MTTPSKIFPIAVTQLNKYQDFLNKQGTQYAKTDEQFLAELREGIVETPIIKAGTLGHKAIENALDGEELDEITEGNITLRFMFKEDIEIEFLPIREQFVNKLYRIGDDRIFLRGKIDGAKPGTIVDYKFGGKFDAEKLSDEYQWRAYLSILGEDYKDVTYSHFTTRELQKFEAMKLGLQTGQHFFDITEHNTVTFTRDGNTENDLVRHMLDFYEWSKRAGYEGGKPTPAKYLPEETPFEHPGD